MFGFQLPSLFLSAAEPASRSEAPHDKYQNYEAPPVVAISEAAIESCQEEKGGLLWPFPLPTSHSASGNLWLLLSYGYVLFSAARLISEGSELLLEILNPGLVGGLLLPTLGALPDSLIIVASGLRGTVQEAQQEVSVGLGVLAGSTVVLLTLAWAASLAAGRCDIEGGRAQDRTLTRGWDPVGTGVTTDGQTRLGARLMMLSTVPYLVVQIPLIDGHPAEGPEAAVIGATICGAGFVLYSIYQVSSPWLQEKRMKEARRRLLRARVLKRASTLALSFGGLVSDNGRVNQAAIDKTFEMFDRDDNGLLDLKELESFLRGVQFEVQGQLPNKEDVALWMEEFDANKTGTVSASEFSEGMAKWIGKLQKSRQAMVAEDLSDGFESEVQAAQKTLAILSRDLEMEEDEDAEDDGEGEDVEDLSKAAIARKATLQLAAGAALVATFADPTVSAIGNFSEAVDVDPFIVAFVVTPLASNASEVVSSFLFALKKRKSNISLCYSQVYGAITMNNTLCLGLFLAIVHLRGLVWDFSAEVTAMVSVILLVGALGSSRNTFQLAWALPVALLYPISLAGVEFLENVVGWQ